MTELRQRYATAIPSSTADSFVITNGASEAIDLVLRVISQRDNGKKTG